MNRCAIIHAPQSALTSFKHTRSRFQIGTKLKLLESNSVLAPLGQKQLVQKQVPWQLFTWDLQIICFFNLIEWTDLMPAKWSSSGQSFSIQASWHNLTTDWTTQRPLNILQPRILRDAFHWTLRLIRWPTCRPLLCGIRPLPASKTSRSNQSNNFAIPTSMSVVDIDTYAFFPTMGQHSHNLCAECNQKTGQM